MPAAASRRLAAAVTALLVLAGCGATPSVSPSVVPPTAEPPASSSPSPSGAATLILRVTSEGGFIAQSAGLAAIPTVSVYADGRILTPGPVDLIYPPPLLPTVEIRDVGPAGATRIAAAIRTAGLDRPSSGGPGGVPGDLGATVFAVNLDGAVVTTRLVLGGGPGVPGLGSPNPSVAAATALLARLLDPAETWGAASVATSVLAPVAYRVFVAPGAPASEGSSPESAVAWPLSTSLDRFGTLATPDRGIPGLRQGAVFGADAGLLGPVLAAANSQTAFISGGMLYTLYVRPLLPDEVPDQG